MRYPTYVQVMFMNAEVFYLWTFDRATSLISSKNPELHLMKKGWVSVLKLSTILNMIKVCRTH